MTHHQELRAVGFFFVLEAFVLGCIVVWQAGCVLDWTAPLIHDEDAGVDAQADEPDASQEADPGPDGSEDHPEADLPQDDGQGTDGAVPEAIRDDAGDSTDEGVLDETGGETPDETPESGVSCNGPFAGEGRTPTPGTCIETYTVGVYGGTTYTITTCWATVNDTVLAVYGDCNCTLYLECGGVGGSGDYCTCTAERDGIMTICSSAFQADEFVRWSYTVEGVCWDAE